MATHSYPLFGADGCLRLGPLPDLPLNIRGDTLEGGSLGLSLGPVGINTGDEKTTMKDNSQKNTARYSQV